MSSNSVLQMLGTPLHNNMIDAHLVVVIEAFLVIVGAAAAWVFPSAGANWFRRVEKGCGNHARSRGLAILVVGFLALAARAALLPVEPIPQPRVHDEFSYLLAGDTFAHGRLTNPTHPMWVHFDTFYALQKPTYMSIFYPAQGLVLAAGQVVAGHPFWGVWFSVGVMCATLCWMLQGWLPAGWAFFGGLLAVFRLALFGYWGTSYFSYWDNSYWGGAVAATGGALVLGALPRLRRSPRVGPSILLGLGLAILANSRPYEGFFLGLSVTIVGAVWLLGKKRPPIVVILKRIVAPLLLVLVPTICAMGYYFWRVTGNPIRIPYLVNVQTYDPVPYFPWQSMRPIPEYHHQVIKDFYLGWTLDGYNTAREHPFKSIGNATLRLATFFLGPLLLMPVAALLLAHPRKFLSGLTKPGKARLLLVLCIVPLLGTAMPVFFNPHYAAPLTGAFYALIVMAIRHLWLWQWHSRPIGRQLVRAVPVLAVAILVLHTSGLGRYLGIPAPSRDFGRAEILTHLQGGREGQLVVVQYAPTHDGLNEWVFNEADIDDAKVVWARDMGASANEELIRYFKDRRVWLLEADDSPPKLLPYPPIGAAGP